jgi:polyisoprenoid-binding protein YceI
MAQWHLDPAHTQVGFSAKHMMFTTVRGAFSGFEGVIDFDPENPAGGSVNVTIQVDTIDTGVADRDAHLRSADFFDVENHPHMTFRSTEVRVLDDQRGEITGELTIRGTTQPVTLTVDYLGVGESPFGDYRVGFEAKTTINREDFGLTWNQPLANGGLLVSKEIQIMLDVQAVRVSEAQPA